jgi:hypothetical protein
MKGGKETGSPIRQTSSPEETPNLGTDYFLSLLG